MSGIEFEWHSSLVIRYGDFDERNQDDRELDGIGTQDESYTDELGRARNFA